MGDVILKVLIEIMTRWTRGNIWKMIENQIYLYQ